MIKTIQNNSLAMNLKPVEIPHFTGLTKIKRAEPSDDFVRRSKKTATVNSDAVKAKARKAAQKGKIFLAETGKKVAKGAKIVGEFSYEFIKTFSQDALTIAEKKLTNVMDFVENSI